RGWKDSWHPRTVGIHGVRRGPTRCSSGPHVRPDLQEHGIAKALLAKSIAQLDVWGTRHVGLFSFAHSAKHVARYIEVRRFFAFPPQFRSRQAPNQFSATRTAGCNDTPPRADPFPCSRLRFSRPGSLPPTLLAVADG